jgi:hypothetical protein
MVITHRGAVGDVHAELGTGVQAQLGLGIQSERDEVMISPLPALLLRSDLIVATTGGYVPGTVDWTERPAVALTLEGALPLVAFEEGITEAAAVAAVTSARLHPDVAHYLVWSRFPYWSVRRAGERYAVTVGDARYTDRGGGLSGLTVTVSATR